MFLIINIRRVWHSGSRKFIITLAVLLSLYLLYQWLGEQVPQPVNRQAIAHTRQY